MGNFYEVEVFIDCYDDAVEHLMDDIRGIRNIYYIDVVTEFKCKHFYKFKGFLNQKLMNQLSALRAASPYGTGYLLKVNNEWDNESKYNIKRLYGWAEL